MGSPVFKFKQFQINQSQCAMKITSDACVFGAYIDLSGAKKLLDIGTGTGLLSLMAAQRSKAEIHAVEIDQLAFEQTTQNFADSPWKQQIISHQGSIQSLIETRSEQFAGQFDTIITNPPFYSEAIKSKDKDKRNAWHDESLTYQELLDASKKCLQKDGTLHVLIPTDRLDEYLRACRSLELFPVKICNMKPFEHSDSHRVIISCKTCEMVVDSSELIIYRGHQDFSKEVRELLSPYFLDV